MANPWSQTWGAPDHPVVATAVSMMLDFQKVCASQETSDTILDKCEELKQQALQWEQSDDPMTSLWGRRVVDKPDQDLQFALWVRLRQPNQLPPR